MDKLDYLKLQETAWRRPLTADEKAALQGYLLVHSQAQQEWEEETALNQLLANVPDAPLSSNFTARVLQEIDLEERREQRARQSGNWLHRLRRWLPRFAVAALVVGLGALWYREREIHSLQEKTKSLDALVTTAAALPDAKIWEDFDAIARMGQPIAPAQDEVLWAALSSSTP